MLKIFTRIALLFCLIAMIPAMILGIGFLRGEEAEAKALYEYEVSRLNEITTEMERAETRLRQLTGSVEAVEKEARTQLRLVRPGERLVLIEEE